MKPSRSVYTSGFFPPGSPWGWPPLGSGEPPQGFPYPPGAAFQGYQPKSAATPPGISQQAAVPQSQPQPQPQLQPPVDFWQQIGGLDGIITHMGKIEKILKMSKSFSPYMKMFIRASNPRSPGRTRKAKRARSVGAGRRRRR